MHRFGPDSKPDEPDEDEGGAGVREPRRPKAPSGADALRLEPDATDRTTQVNEIALV